MNVSVLLLTDRGTKAALKLPELEGLPRIGRGKFSVVFDKGDTVMRLTTDRTAYELNCRNYTGDNVHFPKLIEDYGIVGDQLDDERALFLFETEKLLPLRGNLTARRQCKVVQRMRQDGYDQFARDIGESTLTLEHMADQLEAEHETFANFPKPFTSLPVTMIETFSNMARFATDYEHPMLDFHDGNFMVRPGCGTLVFNDPFADVDALTARMKRVSRGAA